MLQDRRALLLPRILDRPNGRASPTLYDAYSRQLVPQIGKAVAQDEDSYRYLIESIRRFPDMPAFERDDRARPASRSVKAEPILGGLVAIHSGWKI